MSVNRPPLDLRLAPAAVAAWVTTIAVLWAVIEGREKLAFIVVFAGILASLTPAFLPVRKAPVHARFEVGSFRQAGALVALVVAVSAVSAGAHALALAQHEVRDACQTRCTISAVVEHNSREVAKGRWITHVSVTGAKIMVTEALDARVGDRVELTGRISPGLTPPMLGTMAPRSVSVEPARGWRSEFRARMEQGIAPYSRDQRGLIAGMSVGDFSAITHEARDAMVATGTSHLTAISGMHLAIIIGTINALIPGRSRSKIAVLTVLIAGLVAIVGPTPSIIRAVTMAAIPTWGQIFGRRGQPLNSLALVVLGWIVFDPWLALSIGFTLSTLSTLGVLLATTGLKPVKKAWKSPRTLAKRLALAALIPLAATASSAPVLLHMNSTLALYAVPTNVALAPLVMPATLLSLATALSAQVGQARIPGAAAAWLATAIVEIAGWFAKLPGAQLSGVGASVVVIGIDALAAGFVGWKLLPLLVAHRVPHKPITRV